MSGTPERVQALLESHEWVFAKTMADNPHWYTLREKWAEADFVEVYQYIDANGRMERYPNTPRGKPYTVIDIGAYRYWLFGERCQPGPYYRGRDAFLINRKPLEPS